MSDVRFTHLVAFDMPAIICKLAPGPLRSKLSSAMVGERHCCARGMQAGQIPREVTHDENATPGTCYLPGYF